jgi:phosphoribosylformylglycinamidine (FGAM) synthase PurS component
VSERYAAIRLRVPDNTAYSALVALCRLGVEVARVERAIVVRAGEGDDAAVLDRVRRDESLFNPNLHEVEIRRSLQPQSGELLILEDDNSRVSWRLFDRDGKAVSTPMLERARDVLLCNPAIEEAELPA